MKMGENKNAYSVPIVFVYSEGHLFMLVPLGNKKYKLYWCWRGSYDNPILDFEPFTGTLEDFIAGFEGEVKVLDKVPPASIFEGE